MSDSWVNICSDTDVQHIYILQSLLESEGIKSTIVNNASSSIPSVGEAELHVESVNADKATAIINSHSVG